MKECRAFATDALWHARPLFLVMEPDFQDVPAHGPVDPWGPSLVLERERDPPTHI